MQALGSRWMGLGTELARPRTMGYPAEAMATNHTKDLARSGLLLALLCACAALSIPTPMGVPLTLQSALVMVTALSSNLRNGLFVVGAYLLLGAIGLPVFANMTGGLVRFAGPTGGYLFGFLLMVVVIRLLCPERNPSLLRQVGACVAGSAGLFACGLSWLHFGLNVPWWTALQTGCLPFLPLAAFKIAFALTLLKALPAELLAPSA